MLTLARVADRGPLTAAILAVGLWLAALFLPVLAIVSASAGLFVFAGFGTMACCVASAAVVAFVALRHGEFAALQVVGGCLSLMIVFTMVFYGTAGVQPLLAMAFWLPAVVAAFVLVRTVKLNYAVMTLVLFGVLSVVILNLVWGDTTELWRDRLGDLAGSSVIPDSEPALTEQQVEEFVVYIANATIGAVGMLVVSVALGALFLARSWQAALFNPGGFQKEFHSLQLGRSTTLVCVLVIIVAIAIGGRVPGAIASVFIFALFIQGLAVAHAIVKQRGMHRLWLHGLYVLMLLPHTFLLLSALGIADNMHSFRESKEK